MHYPGVGIVARLGLIDHYTKLEVIQACYLRHELMGGTISSFCDVGAFGDKWYSSTRCHCRTESLIKSGHSLL